MARKIRIDNSGREKTDESDRREEQGAGPEESPGQSRRRSHWVWPLGVAVATLSGAAAFLLRGCWHARMSWPIRHDDEFSYQVCTSCGIKRLFDQTSFHGYGPYGYEVHELIARERLARVQRLRRHAERMAARNAPTSDQGKTAD